MVVALVLAVLTSTNVITVAIIYGLAGLRGLVDAVESPTRQAFVPEMVGKAHMPNAIALNSTQFNAARIVGPAIGAAVINVLGIAACFYLNAASFLAVIFALFAMRPRDLQPAARANKDKVLRTLAEGFRYVRSTPDIVLIMIVLGVLGTFGYNFQVVAPLLAKYQLDSGATGLGILMAALGVGAVVGGLIAAYKGKPGRTLLLSAAACFSLLQFGLALSLWQWLSAGLMFVMGMFGVLFMTAANTRLQLLVPEDMRGRVMGMYILLFMGTTPIGSSVIGQLAEAVGVRITILAMGGLCTVGVVIGIIYCFALVPGAGSGKLVQGLSGRDVRP
jgi:MFS family permease